MVAFQGTATSIIFGNPKLSQILERSDHHPSLSEPLRDSYTLWSSQHCHVHTCSPWNLSLSKNVIEYKHEELHHAFLQRIVKQPACTLGKQTVVSNQVPKGEQSGPICPHTRLSVSQLVFRHSDLLYNLCQMTLEFLAWSRTDFRRDSNRNGEYWHYKAFFEEHLEQTLVHDSPPNSCWDVPPWHATPHICKLKRFDLESSRETR